MTEERLQLLNSIGFKWSEPRGQALWNKRFSELVEYKDKVCSHHHLLLPIVYPLDILSFVNFTLSAFVLVLYRRDIAITPRSRLMVLVRSSIFDVFLRFSIIA